MSTLAEAPISGNSIKLSVSTLAVSPEAMQTAVAANGENRPKTDMEKVIDYLLSDEGGDSLSVEKLDDNLNEAADVFSQDVDDHISEFQQDSFVKDAISRGVDLRAYARDIEHQLAVQEEEHILQYAGNTGKLVDLYQQIKSCDSILGSMEDLLSRFQLDLGKLGQEIKSIQDQSLDMSVRLKNRLAVSKEITAVVDGLLVPMDCIHTIMESDVNDQFTEKILELNKKMSYVKSLSGQPIRSFKDIGPEMERLRIRATEKIRAFLLDKIRSLMSPNANVAVIQQSVLLKHKPLYHFLLQRHNEAATELRLNYAYILSYYYVNKFNKYASRMQKLQAIIADKLDLIGLDDSAKKGLFGGGKVMVKDKTNVFTLGDRILILNNIDDPVILPHVAEEQQQKFAFEAIFRSITRTFMDNASSEFCFDMEFFYTQRPKKQESPVAIAQEVFNEVFGKTTKMILESVKNYAENSYDAVGILLCIRVNLQHQLIMQKRRIPCLDYFLNAINLLLWPRFQAIMDLHINSVRKAVASGASNFFTNSVDIHPHYVARKYGEFASSILALNEGYHDHLLETSLARLRVEVESLIGRLAADFQDRKKKLTFLINNYDLIISILEKYDMSTIKAEKEHFTKHLESRIVEFVDEELQPHFGSLISFVAELEKADSLDHIESEKFEKVAKEFAQVWKSALQEINNASLQSFTNFRNGTMVLHTILKQLVYYYQTFLVYWEKRFPPNVRAAVQPVMMHQLVVEIKTKYKTNF